MNESPRPGRNNEGAEQESRFELPKLSPQAAVLLAALAAGAGAVAASHGEKEQQGPAVQAAERIQQHIGQAKDDPFARILGRVLRELDQQGIPTQADVVFNKSLQVGVQELGTFIQQFGNELDRRSRQKGGLTQKRR